MAQPPRSRSRNPAPVRDDGSLPKGQCRYLLLLPEVRGQRCACVGFSLHRSLPGSSCDCGHLAVYHLSAPTEELPESKLEIETLKFKIQNLEKLLEREVDAKNTLVGRVSTLEDHSETSTTTAESDLKTAFRGIEGLWEHFGMLERRTGMLDRKAKSQDERIDAIADRTYGNSQDIRHLQKRMVEVDDASMVLEERLDDIAPISKRGGSPLSGPGSHRHTLSRRPRSMQRSYAHREWTVHISLMPSASQPFPFEKDTIPYKRVLSRGLHRIVTIPGDDSRSFVDAITKEFASLLKGRQWMPLVAKICDAEHLSGLPMLKKLSVDLIDTRLYNFDFLRENCATLDLNGNILDLYIAMCSDEFTWSEIHSAPIHQPNLEGSWEPDAVEEQQIAGDLVRAWSPPVTRSKRKAPSISPLEVFSSSDSEGKRSKFTKTGVSKALERADQRTEAV